MGASAPQSVLDWRVRRREQRLPQSVHVQRQRSVRYLAASYAELQASITPRHSTPGVPLVTSFSIRPLVALQARAQVLADELIAAEESASKRKPSSGKEGKKRK